MLLDSPPLGLVEVEALMLPGLVEDEVRSVEGVRLVKAALPPSEEIVAQPATRVAENPTRTSLCAADIGEVL